MPIQYIGKDGRINKRKVIFDTTSTVELIITRNDGAKFCVFRSALAYLLLTNHVFGGYFGKIIEVKNPVKSKKNGKNN